VGVNIFREVIGSEIIPKGLGHIEVFARTTKRKRKEFCQKAFLVGDGPGDMKLACQAEIYAIGLTKTVSESVLREAGAQEIIHSFSELI
jgi:phosphoglycolate phosphatase-like HAD superfamily hydrolase